MRCMREVVSLHINASNSDESLGILINIRTVFEHEYIFKGNLFLLEMEDKICSHSFHSTNKKS